MKTRNHLKNRGVSITQTFVFTTQRQQLSFNSMASWIFFYHSAPFETRAGSITQLFSNNLPTQYQMKSPCKTHLVPILHLTAYTFKKTRHSPANLIPLIVMLKFLKQQPKFRQSHC